MAKRVFISYRREDTAAVARLVYDRLSRVLTKADVFFDVSAIGGGEDFEQRIIAEISRSDAALVFIGERWLEPTSTSGKSRIWDSRDYVRAEIREAIHRSIRLIPILVSGTRMPSAEQLPDDIKAISTKNALSLRHESFDDDTENIIAALLGADARKRDWEEQASAWSKLAHACAGMTIAAGLVLAAALAHFLILSRPLEASIGTPSTILTAVAAIFIGGWIGLRRATRRPDRR